MLQKLSIMLLSSALKISNYAFKKMPIIPKIMPLIILANNVSYSCTRPSNLMFKSQIGLFSFNCLLFKCILPFCDCYIKIIMAW